MFSVQIMGADSTSSKRYFDVSFGTVKSNNGEAQYLSHHLVPCTKEHWKGFSAMQNNERMGSWFCPEIGLTTSIYGKYTSAASSILSL